VEPPHCWVRSASFPLNKLKLLATLRGARHSGVGYVNKRFDTILSAVKMLCGSLGLRLQVQGTLGAL
jgi:hypothetical protein